jgi:aminoglycoside 3-N-acetyltransferase
MSISHAEIIMGLQELGLEQESKVLVHSSLPALGEVDGGAQTVIESLMAVAGTIVMPAFTYQTLVWPPRGPANNGVDYASLDYRQLNADAVFFTPDLPVHPNEGEIAEAFRNQPFIARSSHPVASFTALGDGADELLATQSIEKPYGPIEWLQHQHGDVLLLGVDHTRNTAIHLAEHLAGRKQFIRWAITLEDGRGRAVELPSFPGCSDGFNAVEAEIKQMTRETTIGAATVRRIPLELLIPIVVGWIDDDPSALLCDRASCTRCNDVRKR